MILPALADIAGIILNDSEGGGILALLAMGPAGAIGFWWMIWRSYRNDDKSHHYERETDIQVSNLTGNDVKVGTNNGTTQRYIQGNNADDPRKRV